MSDPHHSSRRRDPPGPVRQRATPTLMLSSPRPLDTEPPAAGAPTERLACVTKWTPCMHRRGSPQALDMGSLLPEPPSL